MAFEFLSQLDTTTAFLLIIIFILFMLSFKKVLGIIKNALIIVVASVLFPVLSNKFLGLPVPIDGETIVSFAIIGLAMYFLYILGSVVYKALSLFERGAKQKLPSMEKGKKSAEEREIKESVQRVERTKPFVVGNKRARRKWEKDYVEIESKKDEAHERAQKRKKKKARMEKIRVIGEGE